MRRDLTRLSGREFDVLVIGGGIYGLATAYDAALRGLSVALVERSDFGAATSFNHLKTIHGGLRYLQTADFARMRESIRERRTFARIAPRFVAPLAFVMPCDRSLTRNSWALGAALAIDEWVGADRNKGLRRPHRLPAGRVVPESASAPLLDGVLGSWTGPCAIWHDYQTVDGDRLTLSFALAADACGAVLANYVEALDFRYDVGSRVIGVRVRDVITGEGFDIGARMTVNAAGPWAASVLGRAGAPERWPLLKAMNLVTSRAAGSRAVVAPSRAGRALVLLPWRERYVVGTSESGTACLPDDQDATRDEVASFLADVNETFPGLKLQFSEVTLVHRGVVPAVDNQGQLTLAPHSRIIDHASRGLFGLVSVIGAKYTTARAVAERTVDLVMQRLGKPFAASQTASKVLPTAGVDDRNPADPVATAIADEMALTLLDVVVRRTGLGAAGHPGDIAAAACANAMQKALGWSDTRRQDELDALRRFYLVMT